MRWLCRGTFTIAHKQMKATRAAARSFASVAGGSMTRRPHIITSREIKVYMPLNLIVCKK